MPDRRLPSGSPPPATLGNASGAAPRSRGPSKTTRAYQLREDGIVAAAAAAGFTPVHRELNQAPFYFSRLVCFERA